MKQIEYNEEKRLIILTWRWIDLEEIAQMIWKWDILDIIDNPSHPNQSIFIVNYNWYTCCVPFVEDDEKIFLKTAYYSRKQNKLFNS